MNNTMFKSGQIVKFKGYKWKVLDPNYDGGVLLIMDSNWKSLPFDDGFYSPEDGDYPTNNYVYCTLRKELNDFAFILGEDNFISHKIDLTQAYSKNYFGFVSDKVFVLSLEEYFRYADIADYDGWTCTPDDGGRVCCDVGDDESYFSFLPHSKQYVHPACVLNIDKVCIEENKDHKDDIMEIKVVNDSSEDIEEVMNGEV